MSESAGSYSRLRVVRDGPVARVTLARPEVRNAFDEILIESLTGAFLSFGDDRETRVVILEGEGPTFCAGADIEWMRRAGGFSKAENEADAERMARMLRALDECPKPVVAIVQGAAIGGGVGLIAASDVVIAADDAVFSLAEVKLGILPSVISPFVLRAIVDEGGANLVRGGRRFAAGHAPKLELLGQSAAPVSELAGTGFRQS